MKRVITHYPRSMRREQPLDSVVFMLAAWAFLKDERGGWFIPLLIGLALNIVAYLLMPKPKREAPPAAAPGENPVAEANKPIPMITGTVIVKDLNVLDYKDKGQLTYLVYSDGTFAGV